MSADKILCCSGLVYRKDILFIFFKQKTAYEMRISDWSSDVCSSDLTPSATASGLGRAPAAEDEVDLSPVQFQLQVVAGKLVAMLAQKGLRRRVPGRGQVGDEIGRASCRERVCQYV